eukprot:SAG25_NODE_11771_length_295_cov_1.306122_1_plen_63_part_10
MHTVKAALVVVVVVTCTQCLLGWVTPFQLDSELSELELGARGHRRHGHRALPGVHGRNLHKRT